MSAKPLSGIKVIDFTRVLAGPYCSMLLGDLGADVVKVESPEGGDPLRHQGPPFLHGNGMTYLAANRNKRSLALDLKSAAGLMLARQLCRKADVLVENFRPEVMTRLGLGYENLREANPRLIYASISGFGSDGPDSELGAFDLTIQAIGGYMSITGDPEGRPIKLGTSAFDLMAGMNCRSAILAALIQRHISGDGQKVETSLLESQMVALADVALEYLATGALPTRHGAAHARNLPHKAFRTADGWLVINASSTSHFLSLVDALERGDLRADPRFRDVASRFEHGRELLSELDDATQRFDTSTLVQRLLGSGVPYARVNDIQAALDYCRAVHREMVRMIPDEVGFMLPQMGSATIFSGFDVHENWTSPPLRPGMHGSSVLKDWLGLKDEEIAELSIAVKR